MKPISAHEKARVSEDTDCVVEKLREIRKKKKFKSLGERSRVVAKIPWVAVRLLETSADESSEDLTIHWIPDRCMTLRKASSRHAEKNKIMGRGNTSWLGGLSN